jgi:hypothetical protein
MTKQDQIRRRQDAEAVARAYGEGSPDAIVSCPGCGVITASPVVDTEPHRDWCPFDAPAKSTLWVVRCAACRGSYTQDGRTPQPSVCGACGSANITVRAEWV